MPDSRLERFLRKVDVDGPLPPLHPELGPCWLWTGTMHNLGYGRYAGEYAHRVS
jgi:hypothetical protein